MFNPLEQLGWHFTAFSNAMCDPDWMSSSQFVADKTTAAQIRGHTTRSMASSKWKDTMHKKVFTPENAAMLLIDHQVGTMAWTHSHDINLVKQNAIKLARIAKGLNLPVVLTASMEENV